MSHSVVQSVAPAGRAQVTNLDSEKIEDIMVDLYATAYFPKTPRPVADNVIRSFQGTCISEFPSHLPTAGLSTSSHLGDARNTEFTFVCKPEREDPFDPFAPFVADDYIVASPERNDQRLVESKPHIHLSMTPYDVFDSRKVLKDKVPRTLIPVPKEHCFDMESCEKTERKPYSSLRDALSDYEIPAFPSQHPAGVVPSDEKWQTVSGFKLVKTSGSSPTWDAVSNNEKPPATSDDPQDDELCLYVLPNTEASNGLSWDTAGSHMSAKQICPGSEDDVMCCDPREIVTEDPLKEIADAVQLDRSSWETNIPLDGTDEYVDLLSPGVEANSNTRHKRKAVKTPAPRPKKTKPELQDACFKIPQVPKRPGRVDRASPATALSISSGSRLVGPRTRGNPNSERTVPFSPNSFKSFTMHERDIDTRSTPSSSSSSMPSPGSGLAFRCYMVECNETFEDLADVPVHFRNVHITAKLYRCAHHDCDRTTTSIGDMRRHELALAHKAPSFVCKKCTKAFTREDALKRHVPRCLS